MASVRIYFNSELSSSHTMLLERLITTRNTTRIASSIPTGPFVTYRDIYVFAASLGIANGSPTASENMPKRTESDYVIRDDLFLGASGAKELLCLMSTRPEAPIDSPLSSEEQLQARISLLAAEDLDPLFQLLDRFAYSGFELILKYEIGAIRDGLLALLSVVNVPEVEKARDFHVDPVSYFLT